MFPVLEKIFKWLRRSLSDDRTYMVQSWQVIQYLIALEGKDETDNGRRIPTAA